MEVIIIGKATMGGTPLAEVMVGLDYFIMNGAPRDFGSLSSSSGNVPLTGPDGLFGLYYNFDANLVGEAMDLNVRIYLADFQNGRRAPFSSRFTAHHQTLQLFRLPNIFGLMTAGGLSVGTASRALGQRTTSQETSHERAGDRVQEEAQRILDRIGLGNVIPILNALPRISGGETVMFLAVMAHDF